MLPTGRMTTPNDQPLRPLLLALVLFGAVGLLAELLLQEHYESALQWTPLVLLVVVLGAGAAVWRQPSSRTLSLFRAVMALCLAAGALGVVLHLKGNAEFALERDPALTGAALAWKVLRGATPALAPGAMAQLGLLGLVFAHRHPARSRGHPLDQDSVR